MIKNNHECKFYFSNIKDMITFIILQDFQKEYSNPIIYVKDDIDVTIQASILRRVLSIFPGMKSEFFDNNLSEIDKYGILRLVLVENNSTIEITTAGEVTINNTSINLELPLFDFGMAIIKSINNIK